MPRRGDEMPTQREITPGVGRWTWSDGTPLTQSEVDELGLTNAGNAGNFFDDLGTAVGFNPMMVTDKAPGASLDTSSANAQRQRQQDFIAQMQQQAATGDGAWRQQFQDAVRGAQNNAMAVGQSDESAGYGAALRNIGNAQSSVRQRAVGEEEMLRSQAKLDAREQLAGTLGNQAQMDMGQATEEARIAREVRLANQAMHDQTGKNRESTEKGFTSMFGMMGGMSEGGRVPGTPQVFGDDSRNDTVPAMLSPFEIVVPISAAKDPDKAAAFARAVAEQGGAQGLADGGAARGGGETGITRGDAGKLAEKGGYAGYFLGPQIGRSVQYGAMRGMMDKNAGNVIDDSQYQQTAAQGNALASLFAGQAAGTGPSVAPRRSIWRRATGRRRGRCRGRGRFRTPEGPRAGARAVGVFEGRSAATRTGDATRVRTAAGRMGRDAVKPRPRVGTAGAVAQRDGGRGTGRSRVRKHGQQRQAGPKPHVAVEQPIPRESGRLGPERVEQLRRRAGLRHQERHGLRRRRRHG
jgi:hypothetical protein